MEIIGIGTDLVSVPRIQKLLEKNPKQVLAKVFTETEQNYCNKKNKSACHYAARFAAKEAVMKATGTGWSARLGWLDIEVYNEKSGQPQIRFCDKGKNLAEELGIAEAHITLSHSDEMAVAKVILLKK